jgi:3-oxoacyl-[acyl-carrier protein] reductase
MRRLLAGLWASDEPLPANEARSEQALLGLAAHGVWLTREDLELLGPGQARARLPARAAGVRFRPVLMLFRMSRGHLEGKVAIVTGGGAGIGRAIAIRYGEEGAKVAVADVNAETARELAETAGPDVLPVECDVSDPADVDRLFETALERFGTVDVLVNNAGLVNTERHFLEADEAWWERIQRVNLWGVFHCSLRAARIMAAKQAGVIICLSSGGATRAHRGNVAYDAAKGGIEAMVRGMSLDLGPYGVRVCGLVPGSIDTQGMEPETRASRGETVPLRRVGEPADLAGPAVFLASDDASYVTGTMLVVDGGLLAQQRSPQVDIFPLSRYPNLPPR